MAGQISNFRLFLHKISDELGSDELEDLKFLCHDNLTKARLEKIKNSKELFVAIGEVTEDEEKQLDLLKYLFKNIRRLDLESKVKNFQQTRKGEINKHAPFVTSQHVEDSLPPQVNQPGQPNVRNIAGFQQTMGSLPSTAKYGPSSLASHMFYLPRDISLRQAHSGVSSPYAHADSTHNSEEQYKPRTTEINQPAPFVTSQHVEDNFPPQLNQTGQPTLRNVAGFQQATGSLPSTAKYGQSSLASHMLYLLQDKPFRQASSGVSSPYAYADSTPNSEEQHKPHTSEQDSASSYQSQYSVPFGEQEQSSPKDQSAPNSFSTGSSLFEEQHVHEKIEQPHFSGHLQSSPNSFDVESTHHKEVFTDDKIKPQDLPQSSSNIISNLPMATGQGTLRDSGQDKAQHGVLNNTGRTHRGRSWTDGVTADTRSDGHKRISQPSAEKVPVQRVMSNDYHHDVEAAQHLLNKCPVEMNYNSISKYFDSGGKNLGKGGFGIVYEGIRTFHGQSVVIKEEYTSHLGQAFSAAQLHREKRVGYIKHPHLMPLYAFCEEKGKPRCLMYPKMHSDLHKALRSDLKGQQRLPWENRVRIALHTARALLYLHTEVTNERNVRQEIVHMDVKPGNIFLDEDLNARLGDPGMAQELPMEYSYASISQPRGTDGYMDEYLQDRHLKPVNDVFSFGVVLLQLLTQRRAIEKKPFNKTVPLCRVLKKDGVLSDPEKLMGKARLSVWPVSGDDRRNTKEFAAIAIECLKQPDDRAKLSDVCQRLEEILERKGISKASKPKAGDRCVSCLLNFPAKYLEVKSCGCDSDITQKCNYFCVTCLSQARRNPLECPSHGPAEPPIGGSDVYAVLVCGNDPSSPKSAAIFKRDLLGFKSVLTDNRIVGLRNDHVFSITPSSSCGMSQAHQVRQALWDLRQRLQGKRDVFLYFYFSGHSDQNGNLLCWCSSEDDVLTAAELNEDLKLNVNEFMIILDCCYADGKIASEHIKDDNFLVHKSPAPVESMQHPLESLCNNLQNTVSHEDSVEQVSDVSEELPQTGFDTLDGNVLTKAPLGRFTIRQWSSSLSHEESYAKGKGSFFTQFMVCGLRGAHNCQFSNCSSCDRFKAKAKSLGYISAANLEDFVSNHVKNAALAAGGRHQTPLMRTVHSRETILAFYNEEILYHEIVFRSTSGISERISIDDFPPLLLEFQKLAYSKVQGHLPSYAQPKHIQILCDDQEIDATSYVDLQEFVRQGYDVRCQLRPCSSIVNGPVVIEIPNYKDDIITLLTSLQLTRNQQDLDTFEMDTSERTCNAEDVRECFEEEPTLSDLRDTSVVRSIIEILTEASMYQGHLAICVLDDSLECTFTKTLDY